MKPNDQNAPNGHEIVHREDYDGSAPLDDPADEAVALFFAAPVQFRQFKSVKALAENLGVSRMTPYRRAEDVDVVRRIEYLLRRSMFFGDLIASREWAGIVQAQVKEALAGDTRAALFCQQRAWRQCPVYPTTTHEPAIRGTHAIAIWQEKTNEASEQEEPEGGKENPGTEGKDPSE
jgi:hypothetical protein